MNNTYSGAPNYKRTTDKQYSLLKHKLAIYEAQSKISKKSGLSRYKQDNLFWKDLTDKLNKLRPPYRTVQQWKKVWSDHKRGLNKRKSKPKPEVKQNVRAIKLQSAKEIANLTTELKEESDLNTDYPVRPMIKSETDDYIVNSETIHMPNSNDYDNDYSYNDDEHFLQERYENTNESIIPDESTNNSYAYNQENIEDSAQKQTPSEHTAPPPLQPSNCRLPDQSLYALQQHMEHQTKLLEHMSQMSSTMAGLMQRQTDAIEKQTIAMLRQASATEKHTMVMNTFMDMIRTKMQKNNNNTKKKNSGTTINLDSDIL